MNADDDDNNELKTSDVILTVCNTDHFPFILSDHHTAYLKKGGGFKRIMTTGRWLYTLEVHKLARECYRMLCVYVFLSGKSPALYGHTKKDEQYLVVFSTFCTNYFILLY